MEKFDGVSLQTRWGAGIQNPSIDELTHAIIDLKEKDDEHSDAWIEKDDGFVLVASQDRKVKFYNYDTPENIKQRTVNSFDDVLEMWLLFCRGEHELLKKYFG